MNILRRFERRLEKVFEEPFSRVFKAGVHPLEIARRLVREIEDGKALGVNETLAPNCYRVVLSPEDYQRLSGYLGRLSAELESLAMSYTNDRGYYLVSKPRMLFEADSGLKEGEFLIRASLEEAAERGRVEAGGAAQAEKRLGMLTVRRGAQAGSSFLLEVPRVGIGRAEGNDIVLDDPKVSRFHAEIERVPTGYVLRDLESTNGTRVAGRRVKERLLEDGDSVAVGGTEMRFHLVEDPHGHRAYAHTGGNP